MRAGDLHRNSGEGLLTPYARIRRRRPGGDRGQARGDRRPRRRRLDAARDGRSARVRSRRGPRSQVRRDESEGRAPVNSMPPSKLRAPSIRRSGTRTSFRRRRPRCSRRSPPGRFRSAQTLRRRRAEHYFCRAQLETTSPCARWEGWRDISFTSTAKTPSSMKPA